MKCMQCPRRCGADRHAGETGICGASRGIRIARIMLHAWEEPCLTRGAGSGAVFFSGCPLRCEYCQNRIISRPHEAGGNPGKVFTADELAEALLSLEADGASNIDLVSPTQYAGELFPVLRAIKDRLSIPIVWNTGGYENVETIRAAAGLVDIFLTDFKYGTAETAALYSDAPDYPQRAAEALAAMVEGTGPLCFDGDWLTRGVIVRHLVLPGSRRDSMEALRIVHRTVGTESVLLSLMRQYTPGFAPAHLRALSRRVTTFEYESVRETALALGFSGFSQDADSASRAYTPDFTPNTKTTR